MKKLFYSKGVKSLSKKDQKNVKGGFEFGCFCIIDGEMIDWPPHKACPGGLAPMC